MNLVLWKRIIWKVVLPGKNIILNKSPKKAFPVFGGTTEHLREQVNFLEFWTEEQLPGKPRRLSMHL